MKAKGQDSHPILKILIESSYATLLSRILLGGVFLFAGASKALDPGSLTASIRSYGLNLPEWFVSLSAYSLPYLEILLGLYLMAGLFAKPSAWATNALMFLFIVALVQGAVRGLEIDCGCFGAVAGNEAGSLWLDVLRDVGLLALGLHIALAPTGRLSVDAVLRRGSGDEPYGV